MTPICRVPGFLVSARHLSLAIGLIVLFPHSICASQGTASKPNILLIIADDLGWNDVGYNGSEIFTPNIDGLAAEGVILNRFYVSPICSPTRAGLITGRYPLRFGLQHFIAWPWDLQGLPPSETTFAELLALSGYAQRSLIGKWHLGSLFYRHHPLNHGFTRFYGMLNGAIDYFTHRFIGSPDLPLDWSLDFDPRPEDDGLYSTTLLADSAIDDIRSFAPQSEPFLIVLAFNAPHFLNQAPQEFIDLYPTLPEPRRSHAAMVTAMDQSIGNVLDELQDQGIEDNTLVWFLSDNGGTTNFFSGGSNFPLRGEKGSVFEGGIRAVSTVRWPAGGWVGGQTVDDPLSFVDVFPTLAEAAFVPAAYVPEIDGIALGDVLRGTSDPPIRDLHSLSRSLTTNEEMQAIHSQQWKLVRSGPDLLPGVTPRQDAEILLFDIVNDPNEMIDVSDQNESLVDNLLERMQGFRNLLSDESRAYAPPTPPGFEMDPESRVDGPPADVNLLRVLTQPNSLRLIWSNPLGSELDAIRIQKGDGFIPSNPNEGDTLMDDLSESFILVDVVPSELNYLTLYARDLEGGYSEGVSVIAVLEPHLSGVAGWLSYR